MFSLLMKSLWIGMAGLAGRHGLGFRLPKMAGVAGHGHHGRSGVNSVARDTIQRWPVPCTMAEVTKDLGVCAFERPRMPGLRGHGRRAPKWQKRPPLRNGVTHGARIRENLTRFAHMVVVVTSEAPRPVTVADVIRIGCPVHLHRWEDVSIVDGKDGIDGLIDLGLLSLHNFREVLGIKRFDQLANLVTHILLPLVTSDQGVQGELLDPG